MESHPYNNTSATRNFSSVSYTSMLQAMDTATQFWDKVSTSLKSPYDQLDEDDEKHDLDETDFQDGNQQSGRRWKIFIGAGISAVCLALIVLVGYLVKGTRPSEYPCGQSLEEAQSRGCRFDQITWSWIPPHCPVYLSNEYLNATPGQPWLWYVEPYKKIVAREDDWPSIFNNEIRVYGERSKSRARSLETKGRIIDVCTNIGIPRRASCSLCVHVPELDEGVRKQGQAYANTNRHRTHGALRKAADETYRG